MPGGSPKKPGIEAQLKEISQNIQHKREDWEIRRRTDIEKETRSHDEFLRRSRENAGRRVYR